MFRRTVQVGWAIPASGGKLSDYFEPSLAIVANKTHWNPNAIPVYARKRDLKRRSGK